MGITPEQSLKIQENRKKQILDVALALFDQQGYTNTTIADIAQAAGISKGLIYRYFDTKADILFSYSDAMNHCLEELRGFASPKAAIKEFGIRLLSDPSETGYLAPLRVFITVFIKGELDSHDAQNPINNDFGKTFFVPLFQKGQQLKEFKDGNAEEFADVYWHFLLGYMVHIIEKDEKQIHALNLDSVIRLFEGS
ncbi:TetR/AcrR family transcriptional regulator [Neobacillus muris]|uniref:TetR/AcrR family transcriptional regulator n=1 Tax=Neobacillus muris TaxID=2941334 RepID=UPI00203EA418|nr:TetR/AcrR family transcriptional regulator [Neobacillus muris]